MLVWKDTKHFVEDSQVCRIIAGILEVESNKTLFV